MRWIRFMIFFLLFLFPQAGPPCKFFHFYPFREPKPLCAFGKVLLEEWIDDDQRDTGHNDQRIFHQLYKILTLNKVLIILD